MDGTEYFALLHGEQGRGRWQLRIPLAPRQFSIPASAGDSIPLPDEYRLLSLKKRDPRGNMQHLLLPCRSKNDDGWQLILWSLSPGFRGGATYEIRGEAEIIGLGEEAQGDAGRMGGADCPLVQIKGPAKLLWARSGRLYGTPAEWVAVFDGEAWTVGPAHQHAVETAALDYR